MGPVKSGVPIPLPSATPPSKPRRRRSLPISTRGRSRRSNSRRRSQWQSPDTRERAEAGSGRDDGEPSSESDVGEVSSDDGGCDGGGGGLSCGGDDDWDGTVVYNRAPPPFPLLDALVRGCNPRVYIDPQAFAKRSEFPWWRRHVWQQFASRRDIVERLYKPVVVCARGSMEYYNEGTQQRGCLAADHELERRYIANQLLQVDKRREAEAARRAKTGKNGGAATTTQEVVHDVVVHFQSTEPALQNHYDSHKFNVPIMRDDDYPIARRDSSSDNDDATIKDVKTTRIGVPQLVPEIKRLRWLAHLDYVSQFLHGDASAPLDSLPRYDEDIALSKQDRDDMNKFFRETDPERAACVLAVALAERRGAATLYELDGRVVHSGDVARFSKPVYNPQSPTSVLARMPYQVVVHFPPWLYSLFQFHPGYFKHSETRYDPFTGSAVATCPIYERRFCELLVQALCEVGVALPQRVKFNYLVQRTITL